MGLFDNIFPKPSTEALNTAMVMEFIAPGTGLVAGHLVNSNPKLFEGSIDTISNIGKNNFPNGSTNPQNTPQGIQADDDKRLIIIVGLVFIIVIAVALLSNRGKPSQSTN